MWGIIALTKGSVELAKKIKEVFPDSNLYTLKKWNESEFENIQGKLSNFIGKLFQRHKILIFIMATGIVVRVISKYLQNKQIDPGIIVIDEKGKFIISLLSGHLGGANEISKLIAKKIGAQPVITTSSEINHKLSVDLIAKKFNLVINDMEKAKKITSMIVNNEKIAIIDEYGIKLPDYFSNDDSITNGLIIISNKMNLKIKKKNVQLIPKNLVIGIGCKKGIKKEKVIKSIREKLNELEKDPKSIKCLSTVEIKKDELGLHETAEYYEVKLEFIPLNEIKKVEHKFEQSNFVRETIGVSSVSQPCAYLSSNRTGKFLLKKQKLNGLTISIWEENYKFM